MASSYFRLNPLSPAGAVAIAPALIWLALIFHPAFAADLKRIAPLLATVSTADLGTLRKRGVIRVLVTYKKTEYFVVNGQQRGFEYELMEQFENYINKGNKKGSLHVDVVYIPVPFGSLISSLVEGRGDVAAAGLTITPEPVVPSPKSQS